MIGADVRDAVMNNNLLTQGAELMLYGMGTVIIFLSLLVVAMRAMSAGIAKYLPEPEPEAVWPPRQKAAPAAVPPAHVAAIAAALHQHRSAARGDTGGPAR
jgi:oxaloacetate decarboxylase gamma subunit